MNAWRYGIYLLVFTFDNKGAFFATIIASVFFVFNVKLLFVIMIIIIIIIIILTVISNTLNIARTFKVARLNFFEGIPPKFEY